MEIKTAGTPLLWAIFSFIIIAMLMIDLLLQGKKNEKIMTLKHAACWSMLWVSMAMMFNLGFWYHLNHEVGKELANAQAVAFLTGYLIEKALAIDNVFVWLMIFSYFSVPFQLQRRVLILGVLGAILLRVIMIFSGSYLISQFSWLLYVFGAFLVLTGARMALAREGSTSPGNSLIVKWMRKNLRMTSNLEGEKFFVRRNGVLYSTPLLLVLIMVEISDVIFAVDSIPAIFAVTTDPFIVLTSNLFAILGLRAMYFLLANVASRFSLLKYGLAFILTFIGIKMLIVDFYHIPVVISLGVVATTLIVTLLINLWVNQLRLNSPDA